MKKKLINLKDVDFSQLTPARYLSVSFSIFYKGRGRVEGNELS